MRKWAFIVFILGMFVLILLMVFLPVRKIETFEELNKFEVNQKISLTGRVVEERVISLNRKILTLENEIQLVCDCSESFDGKEVNVFGLVSEYDGKRQVEVLRIGRR